MGYTNLQSCLLDLELSGQLHRITTEIDPDQEAGIIQRRAYEAGSPALLFEKVKGTSFPMVANLFGTADRIRYIFRDTLKRLEFLMKVKADPMKALKSPLSSLGLLPLLMHTLPRKKRSGPVIQHETKLSKLPQLKSWPMDGGAYITLPQVYSEDPAKPGMAQSNLGMYRIQISGGSFEKDREVGLHYQIHRGIGSHHARALELGEPLKINIFVGGPPAMTLAAIMPLPETMPEIFFAGALGGHRIPMITKNVSLPMLSEADFCITGTIIPDKNLPEGPFGDHLGYYSLAHDFPAMNVEHVYHRRDAVWPFTTVGRPPQEDTVFGEFIHDIVHEVVPTVYHGVHQVHAVDAAGVHPLLLAVGSERYVPFAEKRQPQELLTCAFSLLGTTQTSLSKYVIIGAKEDNKKLDASDIPGFFQHILERIDWNRDLHLITRTTMDTLDYSGISLNQGSKAILAAAGDPLRSLATELPKDLSLPGPWQDIQLFAPGIVIARGPAHNLSRDQHDPEVERMAQLLSDIPLQGIPLIILCDDPTFTAANWDNFLWVTFTRSDPATDTYGSKSYTHCKHWGCNGPLIIDARRKKHHPAPLETDPAIEKKVEAMAAKGGPLHGLF